MTITTGRRPYTVQGSAKATETKTESGGKEDSPFQGRDVPVRRQSVRQEKHAERSLP